MIPPKRSGRHVLDEATGQAIPLAEWQRRQAAPEPPTPSISESAPPAPEPDKPDRKKPKPAAESAQEPT